MPKSKETKVEAKVETKVEKKTKKTEPVATVAAKVEAPVKVAVVGKKKKRSFKAVYENPNGDVVMGGRYCGAKPKQAGCKALTGIYKLFAEAGKKLKGPFFFGVKETTRGSRNKTYFYSGERIVLDTPVKLQIGGGDTAKTITYKFNSNVKKASEDDCEHLSNPIELDDDAEEAVVEDVVVAAPVKSAKKAKVEKVVEVKAENKVTDTKTDKKSEKKTDKKKQAKK